MEIIKTIKPLANRVITTSDVYENDVTRNGIVITCKGAVKEYQTVVAVGPLVNGIKVGDKVEIDPTNYIKKKYDNSIRDDMDMNPTEGVYIPLVEVDGKRYFAIFSNDIKWVVETEEIYDAPVTKIITPKPAKLIV